MAHEPTDGRSTQVVEHGRMLHEVAHDLARARDMAEVLHRIAESSRLTAHADASCLGRLDRARGDLEVVAAAGTLARAVGDRIPSPALAGTAMEGEEPRPMNAEQIEQEPITAALGAYGQARAALLVPLAGEGGVLGVLVLLRASDEHDFTAEEAAHARAFADLAALAMRHLRPEKQAAGRPGEREGSERLFRLLVQSLEDYAIFMLDLEGRIVSWNPGAERIKGYSEGEIVGEHFSRFYTEEDRASGRPRDALRVAVQNGRHEEEGWRVRKDGSLFWGHVTIAAVRDEAGTLLGFSEVTRDLTQRHRREQERESLLHRRQAAHEQVSTVLERITDAFFALDREWRFTYLNNATREAVRALLQRDPDEVLGQEFWEVVWQFRGTRFEEEYRRAMQTQQPAHFVEYSDALGVWFDVHAYPSPGGLSVYFRDITTQKRIEEVAETERRRLRAVLDALPVGVFISDAAGKLLEANHAAQLIWGGTTPLLDQPESYGVYRGWWPDTGELVQPEDWALARAVHHGEVVVGEEVDIETFDGARKTILAYALPIRDEIGKVTGGVSVIVDITERQRLLEEARSARTEAERANRAKSEFLATMSHEIRTPINAIMGYTELLDMGIAGPLNPAQCAQLERIRSSSTHLLGLINDVLDLSKVEAGRMSVQEEHAVAQHAVGSALALVGPQAAERGVAVDNQCAAGPRTVYRGDEDRVRQILVNLLSNAVKFTEAGGTITVRCGTVSEADGRAHLQRAGPWVFIEVEDTGIGISPNQLETMFQPFVQAEAAHTRTRGGTGLGLTISRQLARLMGGDLTGRSEVGKGSAFTLWLPVAPLPESQPREGSDVPKRALLAEIGRAMVEEVDSIMAALTDRIRKDPSFPGTANLSDADLQDHGVAFLSDIAQSLVAWEKSDVEPVALLRDGGEIQRVISELHGAQRGRLGWGREEMRREFQILREEVEHVVRRRVRADEPEQLDTALGVLMRFLDSAERISCRAVPEG